MSEVINELFDLFGFCPCGAPWKVATYIREYLTEISKDLNKRVNLKQDAAYWMAGYLCDAHGLTEHGGSVGGAWLTDLGKEWLEKLKSYEE
jgi:hypothetical protein